MVTCPGKQVSQTESLAGQKGQGPINLSGVESFGLVWSVLLWSTDHYSCSPATTSPNVLSPPCGSPPPCPLHSGRPQPVPFPTTLLLGPPVLNHPHVLAAMGLTDFHHVSCCPHWSSMWASSCLVGFSVGWAHTNHILLHFLLPDH